MAGSNNIIKQGFTSKQAPEQSQGVGKILTPACPTEFDASVDCSPVTIYDADGVTVLSVVPAGGQYTVPPNDDVDIDAAQRTGPDVDVSSVTPGGSFVIPVTSITDDTDTEQAVAQYLDTVKIMHSSFTVNINGQVVEITVPSPDAVIDAEQRTGPDASVTTVPGGDTFVIPTIDVLDSDDAVIAEIEYGDNIKIMNDYDSISVVGTQVRVETFAAPVLKPCPIHVQPPSPGATSFYSGDFIDQYQTGNFDFYNYGNTPVTMMRLGADSYTLHADTPNPWGSTVRYTDTDGNPPVSGQVRWLSYPVGYQYFCCDWLHRIMWYQPNLGGFNWEGSLDEVAAKNTAVFGGFSDWFLPSLEFFMQSGCPDPSNWYYNVQNVFMRGTVSGFNDTIAQLSRRAELSTGNNMSFFSAYDWRRTNATTTTAKAPYMCRFIQDSDPFLP